MVAKRPAPPKRKKQNVSSSGLKGSSTLNKTVVQSKKEPLALGFRPRIFDDVVGQDITVMSLIGKIKTGRIPKSFLFLGPVGCGKTTLGRVTSSALNCQNLQDGYNPCVDRCESCRDMMTDSHPDFTEVNASDNRGIDYIRSLKKASRYAPRYNYRIWLMDEAHNLTKEAISSFLKGLEEPAGKTLFMLATSEVHKLPKAVNSRGKAAYFKINKVESKEISKVLANICKAEKINFPAKILDQLAVAADGHVRDAIGLLENVITIGSSSKKAMDNLPQIIKQIIPDPPHILARKWLLACRQQDPAAFGIVSAVASAPFFLDHALRSLKELFLYNVDRTRSAFPKQFGYTSSYFLAQCAEILNTSHRYLRVEFADPQMVLLTATLKLYDLANEEDAATESEHDE